MNIHRLIRPLAVAALTVAAIGWSGPAGGAEAPRVLTVDAPGNPDFLDSALADEPSSWQILAATNDGLLMLRQSAGGAGLEAVPDLAEALPVVSDGGRTLTFRVRSGVRFSDPVDREVRPSDVKASIERIFRLSSRGASYYGSIVGADVLTRTRTGGLAGVVADDTAGTVVVRLTRPDPSILTALAMPFADVMPKETPAVDQSVEPPVATGPYRVTSYDPNRQIVLERNTGFRQWTPDRPDGVADRIVVRLGVTGADAIADIQSGRADLTQSPLTPAQLTAAQRAGVRVAIGPAAATDAIAVTAVGAPLTDPRVRTAIARAVDRRRLIGAAADRAWATVHLLPGAATGQASPPPRVASARALVSAAGATGAAVDVIARSGRREQRLTAELAAELRRIGLVPNLRLLSGPEYARAAATGAVGLRYVRLAPTLPDPAGYVSVGRPATADLSRLAARAAATYDPAARWAAWRRVDAALYRAKDNGRNQVLLADQPEEEAPDLEPRRTRAAESPATLT
ncbi:MAG TPA: ABC transporter substrate-binding protein [Miltoncostaeaceae bacterium]|nr:ABC transporter substrate-binding protein [Miltoncostaeaceae bacterium]